MLKTKNLTDKDLEILQGLKQRIVASDSFGKSAVYENLLDFLIKSTINNEVPKETTIASHLFGDDKAYQDSSQVRVYIYHLRKKLNSYFENEGKEERYFLKIPKGRYKVELKEKEDPLKPIQSGSTKKIITVLSFIIILSLAINLYLLTSPNKHNQINSNNSFWKEFVLDEKPVLIILGDLFAFSETDLTTKEIQNIRIPYVNSKDDFEAYQKENIDPNKKLEELNYSFLVKGSAKGVGDLNRVLVSKTNLNVRVLSRITTMDIHDSNIIFVGMQKTAGIFNNYFESSSFSLLDNGGTGYQLEYDGKINQYTPSGDPSLTHTDYGFIAKYPGPNNNTIFMFSGIWDTGTFNSLQLLTDESKSAKIKEEIIAKLGEIPPYFEMLIEVSGIDRIGFDTKILWIKSLEY